MSDIKISFEDWLLGYPDIDESLLEGWDEDNSCYTDTDVNDLWFAFRAGYNRGEKG